MKYLLLSLLILSQTAYAVDLTRLIQCPTLFGRSLGALVQKTPHEANGEVVQRFQELAGYYGFEGSWGMSDFVDEFRLANYVTQEIRAKWPKLSPVAERAAVNYFLIAARDLSQPLIFSPAWVVSAVLESPESIETQKAIAHLDGILSGALEIAHSVENAGGSISSRDAIIFSLNYKGLAQVWSTLASDTAFAGPPSKAQEEKFMEFLSLDGEPLTPQNEGSITQALAQKAGFGLIPLLSNEGKIMGFRWVSMEEARNWQQQMVESQQKPIGF